MELKTLLTEEDYRAALIVASLLFNNPPEIGTSEGDDFELLIASIDVYERLHFPINAPEPIS